jgi:hypothetical protein
VHTPRCLHISGEPSAGSALPDAYDFFTQLPCLSRISVATAVMLSARFGYVTPSGEVPGCGGQNYAQPTGQLVEQYIDGGYAEASGLATLQGVLPDLMALVAQYNQAQLAKPGTGAVSLVVPVVAFLPNTPIVKPVSSQPLLPASRDAQCASAAEAVSAIVSSGIVVVAPRQQAGGFAVPLGWVLSQASEQSLTADLSAEATKPCNADGIYCAPGTEGLYYLRGLTRSVSPS